MLLDIFAIIILIIAVISGRRSGLFRTVARLLSFVLAALCTSLWGDKLKTWMSETKLYERAFEKLSRAVGEALNKGETKLLEPFLKETEAMHAADTVAQGVADSFLLILCFVLFSFGIRLLIEVLDKLVFHLPLIRPLNRVLGMIFSFVFTLLTLYLVIGALGGVAMYVAADFMEAQMQSSILVRAMYENNIVLNLLIGKG